MKTKILIFLLLILLSKLLYAVDFEYLGTYGNFRQATAFALNPNGFLYITDSKDNKVICLDTNGNYINDAGGFGWCENCFDNPVDIFATPLNVLITDKNNHRLLYYDKSLNLISNIDGRDAKLSTGFGQPNAAKQSNNGFLFVLDDENKRILKYSTKLRFELDFGGKNFGTNSISGAKNFAITNSNNIIVPLDSILYVFDNFGSFVTKIPYEVPIKNVSAISNNYLLVFEKHVKIYEQTNNQIVDYDFFPETKLNMVNAIKYKNKLYILTENNILIFRKL